MSAHRTISTAHEKMKQLSFYVRLNKCVLCLFILFLQGFDMGRALILAVLFVAGFSSQSVQSAGDMIGRARVVDGDTLELAGERIRLLGIDAPEQGQSCRDKVSGRVWLCGIVATRALVGYIGGRVLICEPEGRDRYRRVLASCYIAEASALGRGDGVGDDSWHKGLDDWLDGFAGVGGDAWGSWIDNLTGGGSAHKVGDGATGGAREGVRMVSPHGTRKKGDDIAAWMLTNGWSIVYRGERSEGILKRAYYWTLEAMARAASRGIYTSHFTPPAQWRK